MEPGDLVLLPDGRYGFYQKPQDGKPGFSVVLVTEQVAVQTKELKRAKE